MAALALRNSIKIGIATALAIILFQLSNIFLVYKYFKFDYYITLVAILFLVAGFFISKYNHPVKLETEAAGNPLHSLTTKEVSILKLIVGGKSNKEIAALNFVEISTIKTHINNIYSKLGLKNRGEAINSYKTKLVELDWVD